MKDQIEKPFIELIPAPNPFGIRVDANKTFRAMSGQVFHDGGLPHPPRRNEKDMVPFPNLPPELIIQIITS
jgi:hypothetical protein